MIQYQLTIEDGVITWIEDVDSNGNHISGVLFIPEDALSFSQDAWAHLGCDMDGILVHQDNPVFSSAYNCLLSKDGKKLIKTCKSSDISKLTDVTMIGRDAFQNTGAEMEEVFFRIPDGVEVLDYRAFAMGADKVEIIVPSSVRCVHPLAFMIHSQKTRIIFEGDALLRIGTFGTAAEAADSDLETFRRLPAVLYPKANNITVSCKKDSQVASYCKEYGIPMGE